MPSACILAHFSPISFLQNDFARTKKIEVFQICLIFGKSYFLTKWSQLKRIKLKFRKSVTIGLFVGLFASNIEPFDKPDIYGTKKWFLRS